MNLVKQSQKDVELKGADLDVGLAGFLAEKALEEGAEFASGDYDHPVTEVTVLRVRASSPKKVVADAVKSALEDVKAFEKSLGVK